MPLLTELLNRIPKRNLSNSLRELGVNNIQSLEIPKSEIILSNFKPNGFSNNELTSFINNSYGSQRIPIEENNKRSIIVSPSINFNYLTPPSSPFMSCEEDKKKSKKSKNIGVNTEKTEKIESEGFCLKFPTNLSKASIFLSILIFSIGIIII